MTSAKVQPCLLFYLFDFFVVCFQHRTPKTYLCTLEILKVLLFSLHLV